MLTKPFLGIFLNQGICKIELSVFDITQFESIPSRQNPKTAFQHHSAPVAFQESLSASNTVFTMLFTIECTLKMMPQGCRVVKGFKHRDSKILHLICFIAHLTMVISPFFGIHIIAAILFKQQNQPHNSTLAVIVFSRET